jgi:hypothetical protein
MGPTGSPLVLFNASQRTLATFPWTLVSLMNQIAIVPMTPLAILAPKSVTSRMSDGRSQYNAGRESPD